MNDLMKHCIKTIMKTFPEVQWDRYIEDGNEGYIFYGWIEREQDAYKDFITVELDEYGNWYYITSSAKYSKVFSDRINPDKKKSDEHKDCKRLEDVFPYAKNVIKLGATT